MHRSLWIGALALVGLSGQALAQEAISYSYLEADYLSTDYDDLDVDGDGFGVQGAIAFTPMLHGYVEYTNQDFDFDIGYETVEIGVGANWSVAPSVSVVGRLGYANAELESFDDDGFALQGGVRAFVGTGFELEGLIHYVDFGDGDNTSFRALGRYWFTPNFSAGVGAEIDSDVKTWLVGARYSFGK